MLAWTLSASEKEESEAKPNEKPNLFGDIFFLFIRLILSKLISALASASVGISGVQKKRKGLEKVPSSSDSLGARTQDPILKRDVLYLLS